MFNEGILDDMLRERLVCRLRNEHIQEKLLSVADRICKSGLDITVSIETASRDATYLQSKKQSTSTATSVHKLYA